MQRTTIFLLWLLGVCTLQAQNPLNFFSPLAEHEIVLNKNCKRILIPNQAITYKLDFEALKMALLDAPMEFTAESRKNKLLLQLPNPDGSMETYSIFESPVMHPDLMAKFPSIKTYAGVSLKEKGKTIRFTISPRGLKSYTFKPDTGTDYVEPFAQGQTEYYMAYDRKDYPAELRLNLPLLRQNTGTTVEDVEDRYTPTSTIQDRGLTELSPVNLKIYRYAVTTTGEFAQDNGGTKELVLAKIVEINNQLSGIFERDMQLRLQLIALSEVLIFLDPNTDPFNGIEVGDFMSQNPAVINPLITISGYDIGHNYCRYQGGNAAGVAGGNTCTSTKGRGSSSGGGDYGDSFINVVGQEVGHQMSGGHTWNRCGQIGGRVGNTAFEPGSGTTIMSYAGSCGSDNVQGFSDLYYHSGSIEEIQLYYENGPGSSCGTTMLTDNNHPQVSFNYTNNFFIPKETPFELDGTATDPDGDAVTYCWEQMDTGPERPLESPQGNSPLFRTLLPTTKSNRYFPKLSTVLNNGFDLNEQLPTYTRDMTFRLTARDNRTNGGGVNWKDVEFKATDLAGPFLVNSPNVASEIWRVGEYARVTWDVANTDKSPVNCSKVNILLSINGGVTFPITLASNVNNDGSQYVLVPNNIVNNARVRINAVDNVFYDISNANFKIQQPTTAALSLGLDSDGGQLCLPAKFSTSVLSTGVLGFNSPVSLSIENPPVGAVTNFGNANISPGESTTLDVDLSQVEEGNYTLQLVGVTNGTDTLRRSINLTTVSNDFSDLTLLAPLDGSTGMSLAQFIYWNKSADANLYGIEFGTSPSFSSGSIFVAKNDLVADSLKISNQLMKATAYYWRVRPKNECGTHDWTEPFFFSTKVDNCTVFEAQDLPKNLTSNGTPTVESKIFINNPGTVEKVVVKSIAGSHTAFKDLETHLISPTGTDILLWKNRCGTISVNFNLGFDDESPNAFQCPPSNAGLSVKSANPLSTFDGQSITGAWTLIVKDNNTGSGGSITGFKLEFCSSASLNSPYVVNNNALQLTPGTNALVSPDLLLVEDLNNSHEQLTFTLLTLPHNGLLRRNGVDLVPGDQFTQTVLDNNEIRYYDYGPHSGTDDFKFVVSDGEGGFLGTTKFVIQPYFVGTQEQILATGFRLFPNPANESVTLSFEQSLLAETKVSLFNISGQLLRSNVLGIGTETYRFSLQTLPQGIYSVVVQNENGLATRKLVVR